MGKDYKKDKQLRLIQQGYGAAEKLYQPFKEAGDIALGKIKAEAFDLGTGKLWDYMYSKGLKLIKQEAAARGLVKSGPGMKAVTNFTEEMALQHIQYKTGQWWNLTNLGQWATSNIASLKVGAAESQAAIYRWVAERKQADAMAIGNTAMSGISMGLGAAMGGMGGGGGGTNNQGVSTGYQPGMSWQPQYYAPSNPAAVPASANKNFGQPSYYQ